LSIEDFADCRVDHLEITVIGESEPALRVGRHNAEFGVLTNAAKAFGRLIQLGFDLLQFNRQFESFIFAQEQDAANYAAQRSYCQKYNEQRCGHWYAGLPESGLDYCLLPSYRCCSFYTTPVFSCGAFAEL
jgi:hypothetical protein